MEKLAILGGQPAKTKDFPAWPQYDEAEEKAVLDVLHSRVWWRTPGTQTLSFENRFAEYQQANMAWPAPMAPLHWKLPFRRWVLAWAMK
ncbi:MAG: hypothetical protein LWX83_01460 [Anaerolineae bacterium]|nr:hypothetical protein [Anaerolineae bacterium]